MFVLKSCQKTIFDLEFDLPEPMHQRMKQTWAEVFQQVVMPLLLKAEKGFADLYCQNNGAPNTPVALLLGVLVLKDLFDLTDEETLEHLEYNLLWQHALSIRFEEAHVCRKTLHNFRVKLLESGRHRELFTNLTKKIIELFGLKIGRQRLDSTHIVGNMKLVGRLALFVQTIEQFLFKLKRMSDGDPEISRLVKELPEGIHKRYLEREGYFGDARSSQAPRRLQTCAQDIWLLLESFQDHPTISGFKQFKTLKRLFNEQCEIVHGEDGQSKIQATAPDPKEDEPDKATSSDEEATGSQQITPNSEPGRPQPPATTVQVKAPESIGADSLQSPTDTDATYGHKGKGYEYQVAETCDERNPFQVITATHLNGANESDQTQTIPMLEKLEQDDLKPERLQVDAGYVSGANIVVAQDVGTRLVGPLPGKPPNPENLSLAEFEFADDDKSLNRCPNQKCPVQQGDLPDNQGHWAIFSPDDCADCPLAAHCPIKGKRDRRIEWDREKLAIARRHKEVQTKEFKEEHKIRSGIEATNSELKHKHGAAGLKVRGYARIDFAMTFKVLAINIKRMFLYLLAQCKRLKTDGAPNPVTAIICFLASLLLVFIAFARINRQKTYFALKGMDFGSNSLQGLKTLAL